MRGTLSTLNNGMHDEKMMNKDMLLLELHPSFINGRKYKKNRKLVLIRGCENELNPVGDSSCENLT